MWFHLLQSEIAYWNIEIVNVRKNNSNVIFASKVLVRWIICKLKSFVYMTKRMYKTYEKENYTNVNDHCYFVFSQKSEFHPTKTNNNWHEVWNFLRQNMHAFKEVSWISISQPLLLTLLYRCTCSKVCGFWYALFSKSSHCASCIQPPKK